MNVLVLLPFWNFISNVLSILNEVYSDDGVCYISLNKPYRVLATEFKKANIEESRVFVIDAVTKTVLPNPKKKPNCMYIDAPIDLEELETALRGVIKSDNYGVVVLDSISTLLIYQREDTILDQIKRLSNILEIMGCEGVFTSLKEDLDEDMISRFKAVMDRVTDLT